MRKERPSLKLLYVTPEQLVASTALLDALQDLRRRGLLPRFVVDEVCRTSNLHAPMGTLSIGSHGVASWEPWADVRFLLSSTEREIFIEKRRGLQPWRCCRRTA